MGNIRKTSHQQDIPEIHPPITKRKTQRSSQITRIFGFFGDGHCKNKVWLQKFEQPEFLGSKYGWKIIRFIWIGNCS